MGQVVKSQNGSWYEERRGEWVEVSEDEARGLKANALVSSAMGAGGAIGEMGAGAGQLLGIEGAADARAQIRENTDAYRRNHPDAFMIGQAAPFAVPFAGGARTAIAADAALGAAADPDNPLRGAAIGAGGALAGAGAGVLLSRGASMADRVLTGTANATRRLRLGDDVAEGSLTGELGGSPGSILGQDARSMGQAVHEGFTNRIAGFYDRNPDLDFNRAAQEKGFRLTPGVAQGSHGMRNLEAGIESSAGGAAAFRELRQQNEDVIKGAITKALGGEGTDLGPEALGRMKSKLSDKFEDAAGQAGTVELMPTTKMLTEELAQIDDPVTRVRAQGLVENLPARMDGKELYQRMSKIRKDADNHLTSPSGDRAVGEAFDRVADALEEAFSRNLPAPVQATLADAKQRWRMLRTLERGKGVTSDGEVNVASLDNALRGGYKNEYRYGGKSGNSDIDNMMETVRLGYGMRDIVGNSGTATREQNLIGALTTGPLENLAARAYLGDVGGMDLVKGAGAAGLGYAGGSAILGD